MVNYLAILVAAVLHYGLGALWYSPLLFGKVWMKLNDIDAKKAKEMQEGGKSSYAYGFVTSLVMAWVLAIFIGNAGTTTALQGAITGAWLWLGFIATVSLGSVLWDKKPFKLYLLNNAFNLVGILIMGGILGVWV